VRNIWLVIMVGKVFLVYSDNNPKAFSILMDSCLKLEILHLWVISGCQGTTNSCFQSTKWWAYCKRPGIINGHA